MRLKSITVRNFRVHREVSVEFDEARTLIGGPNESGKSTLVEAVHRALFLRAKTTGDVQVGLTSRHGGHPEVELHFEAGGCVYRLHKRFSGGSGTVRLSDGRGGEWTGDEAEEKIADALQVNVVKGGQAKKQWAHLWVWQGAAGTNPTEHAQDIQKSLFDQLQRYGGAVVIQSALDAQVAQNIADQHTGFYTLNGKPRGELANAMAEQEDAEKKEAAARQVLERMEKAIADFEEAEQTIRTSQAAMTQLSGELEAVKTKLGHVADLKRQEEAQGRDAQSAAERHQTEYKADLQIRQLHEEVQKLAQALAPQEAEIENLTAREAEQRRGEESAEESSRLAEAATRGIRLRHDLSAAYVQSFEKEAQCEQLSQKLQQAEALNKQIATSAEGFAQIPAINARDLKALHDLENESSKADAALGAIATGVEVIETNTSVAIEGRTVASGESEVITSDAEIIIGNGTRLRIRPGGGTSLAQAQQRLHEARSKLQRRLDVHGIDSIVAAAEAVTRRQQVQAEMESLRAQLNALGFEESRKTHASTVTDWTAAKAEVERRRALVEGGSATPADLDEARSQLKQRAEELHKAEAAEATQRAARDLARRQLQDARVLLDSRKDLVQQKRHEHTAKGGQARLLVEIHGEEEKRVASLAARKSEAETALHVLQETRKALIALQPGLLESDHRRVQRALEQHAVAKNDAEQKRAAARAQLQRDGVIDPQAEFALAQSKAQFAKDHRESLERKAGAVGMLHELFKEEHRALAEQFTAPLAEKISGYLQCMFGAEARAAVTLEDNRFTKLHLMRGSPPAAFEFDDLSGGTREQLAAAVRLAIAEVLSEPHGGSLPVVFDDAFTNSDPARLGVLQRMLDRGAAHGLQIIILTCSPLDYATLGARQVLLRSS